MYLHKTGAGGNNNSVVHAAEWAIWMREWWTDRRCCVTRFGEEVFAATLLKITPQEQRAIETLVDE